MQFQSLNIRTLFFTLIILSNLLSHLIYGQLQLNPNDNIDPNEIIKNSLIILEKDPQNLKAILSLAESFYRLGEYRNCIQYTNIAENILSANSKDSILINESLEKYFFYILQTRGKARHKLGDLIKAKSDYFEALLINDNDSDLLVDIGNLYYNTASYDSALLYFVSAEKISPKAFKPKFNMANVFYILKSYDSALVYYDLSSIIKPDFPYVYYYKGMIYNEIGKYNLAIEEFSTSIRLWPDNTELYFKRGITYQKIHLYKQALTDWETLLKLDSTNYDALRNRAITYIYLNQQKEAFADLEILIRNNPNEILAYHLRGEYNFLRKKYKKALPDLLTAEKKGIDTIDLLYQIGYSYRKLKEISRACIYLSKVEEEGFNLDKKSKRILIKCQKESN